MFIITVLLAKEKIQKKKDNRHNFVFNNNNNTSFRKVCPALFSVLGLINPVVLFILNNYGK